MHTVGWILRVSVATWFPTLRIYIRVLHVVIIQEPGSRSLVSLFWLRSLYVITLQSVTNELWLFRHRLQGVTRELVLWLKRTHRFAVCGKLDSLRFSALNVRVGQVVYRPLDLMSDKCARFCALDIISTHAVWLSLNKIHALPVAQVTFEAQTLSSVWHSVGSLQAWPVEMIVHDWRSRLMLHFVFVGLLSFFLFSSLPFYFIKMK